MQNQQDSPDEHSLPMGDSDENVDFSEWLVSSPSASVEGSAGGNLPPEEMTVEPTDGESHLDSDALLSLAHTALAFTDPSKYPSLCTLLVADTASM
jgi:hypothetical protein